jgi:hypothetical protein
MKEGFGVKGGPKTGAGDFTNNFTIYIYTYMPQNIYTGCVSVFDKYLHWFM